MDDWREQIYNMMHANVERHGRRSDRYMAWRAYVIALLEANDDICKPAHFDDAKAGFTLDAVDVLVRAKRVTLEELIAAAALVLDGQPLNPER